MLWNRGFMILLCSICSSLRMVPCQLGLFATVKPAIKFQRLVHKRSHKLPFKRNPTKSMCVCVCVWPFSSPSRHTIPFSIDISSIKSIYHLLVCEILTVGTVEFHNPIHGCSLELELSSSVISVFCEENPWWVLEVQLLFC